MGAYERSIIANMEIGELDSWDDFFSPYYDLGGSEGEEQVHYHGLQ